MPVPGYSGGVAAESQLRLLYYEPITIKTKPYALLI
jgi:hypothetical protein